ncbi:hypothetical protein XENTR_v10009464 [Xenopus tropicalis]|nr:hypothetical protein XENTR_v10009464 [Xenopus tropicalis]
MPQGMKGTKYIKPLLAKMSLCGKHKYTSAHDDTLPRQSAAILVPSSPNDQHRVTFISIILAVQTPLESSRTRIDKVTTIAIVGYGAIRRKKTLRDPVSM